MEVVSGGPLSLRTKENEETGGPFNILVNRPRKSTKEDYSCRNESFVKMGYEPPKAIKTGTTIVGLVYKDGIIVGADSRATSGNVIADKFCLKLHKITDSIYAGGAGTAADLEQVGEMLAANMKLLELEMGRKAQVATVVRMAKQHLFKYMGHVGAYLIVGGVDFYGPHLYNVHAGGNSLAHSFVADGSGSLCAISILEREYRLDMNETDALDLLNRACMAGMHGDLNSGNSYCFNVITKNGCRMEKFKVPEFCQSEPKLLKYTFPAGTTKPLKQKSIKYDIVEEMEIDKPSSAAKTEGDRPSAAKKGARPQATA